MDPGVADAPDGVVEANAVGRAVIRVVDGALTDSATVFVFELPTGGPMAVRGLGVQVEAPATTDLWLHGALGLTGSSFGGGACPGPACLPQPIVAWDLSNPDRPVVSGTIPTESASINDVKISPDGRFAVASRQGTRPGLVILRLNGVAVPEVVTTYSRLLERGVHNLWIEPIDGVPYVFAAENGSSETGGLHVLDMSDLESPVEVGHYYAGSSSVHDVYVRDGLAFVSHWDAGLVILDVGNGVRGGSPARPIEVSRIELDGETHNAWYWPARQLVFVGEEDFQTPSDPPGSAGRVHVVDVQDLEAPVEIGTFASPDGVPPHNFWVDEARGLLYVGWYQRGMVALDVNGDLTGELEGQGREVAIVSPRGPLGNTSFWAPQLHNGRVYGADTQHGIWVFDPPG